MMWTQRIVNEKLLHDPNINVSFNMKDKDGKYELCWNERFEGNTPRQARKAAREKYPLNKGYRLGFTRKVKK
jgi:hypothetical protein